jgi:hypothetical protein
MSGAVRATPRLLIGLTGRKFSGKDACADIMVSLFGCAKRAFATPLKQVCSLLFGLDDEQLNGRRKEEVDARYGRSPRQLMQLTGTEWVRNQIAQDFWLRRFAETLAESKLARVVVCDVRFQNELDLLHSLGGRVFRVQRDRAPCPVDAHVSEAVEALSGIDGVLQNNGTLADLEAEVSALLRTL